MCVIAVSALSRPTVSEVDKMWSANPHGGGVAWREGGKVKWVKGIKSPDEMFNFAERLPQPYVLHFRVPSVGGPHPLLTHPFPVSEDSWLALEGETDGAVMFHNGTFHGWKDKVWEVCMSIVETGQDAKMPGGRWSDSRAMAWIAGICGTGILSTFNEKIVVLTPTDYDAYGNWDAIGEGLWVSNVHWNHGRTYTGERSSSIYMGTNLHDDDDDEEVVRNAHTRPTMGGVAPPHGTTASGKKSGVTGTSNTAEGVTGVTPDNHPFRSGATAVHHLLNGRVEDVQQNGTQKRQEADGQNPEAEGGTGKGEEGDGGGEGRAIATVVYVAREKGAEPVKMLRYPDGTLTQLGDAYVWAKKINGKQYSTSRPESNLAKIAQRVALKPHDEFLRSLTPEERDNLKKEH
jgi:hypothetical protein